MAIIGTGRADLHHVDGSSSAAPTIPIAAKRSGILHDRTKLIPPPLERPFA